MIAAVLSTIVLMRVDVQNRISYKMRIRRNHMLYRHHIVE